MDKRPSNNDQLSRLVNDSPLNVWMQAKVDFNINTAPLAPEKVADSLMKASALANMAFHPVVIEKPVVGTIVLVKLAPNQPARFDGYGWAGEEEKLTVSLNQTLKLQLCINHCGFDQENGLYLVERTRYYLINENNLSLNDLQLIRWTSTPIEKQASVDASKITVWPRRVELGKRGVIPLVPPAGAIGVPLKKPQNPGPTVAPGAGAFAYQSGVPIPAHLAGQAFSATTIRAANAAAVNHGMPNVAPPMLPQAGIPISGAVPVPGIFPLKQDYYAPNMDELDVLHSRDVALLRFKRNHEFCEELFSLHPVSSLVPTSALSFSINVENFDQKKLEYAARIDRTKNDIEHMKQKHAQRVGAYSSARDKISRELLQPLSHVSKAEDLQNVTRKAESLLDVKFMQAPLYRAIDISEK